MDIRKTPLQLAALAVVTILICTMAFLLDHEVEGLQDLLRPENAMAYLLFGAPLWAMMTVQLMLLNAGHRALFALSAAATATLVGFMLWVSFSHAPTTLGQLRNYFLETIFVGLLITGPVMLLHRLGRKSQTGQAVSS